MLGPTRLGGAKLEMLGGGLSIRVESLSVHVDGDFRHYFQLADQRLGKALRAET